MMTYHFITLCTKNRENFFGMFPDLKQIVFEEWDFIEKNFPLIKTDEFIIMPDHIHGIIRVGKIAELRGGKPRAYSAVDAGFTPASTTHENRYKIVREIVSTFKSRCVFRWLKEIKYENMKTRGRIWQRGYYERTIRGLHDLKETRRYIKNNRTHH